MKKLDTEENFSHAEYDVDDDGIKIKNVYKRKFNDISDSLWKSFDVFVSFVRSALNVVESCRIL